MIKNAFWRLLLKSTRPFQRKQQAKDHNFLIVSTTGVGDTLWASPAIRSLKETFPKCMITVLTSPMGKEVLDQNPYIDRFYVLADPVFPKMWKLRKILRKSRFSHALVFHTSQRSILPFLSYLSIPAIIGTKGLHKGLDDLLTQTTSLKSEEHEIERRLQLIESIGGKKTSTQIEMFLSAEEIAIARQYEKPYTIFHPGSKDTFKRWPKDHFISTAKYILEKESTQIIITGNKGERELCNDLAEKIPGAISLAGKLSLRELAALIKQASMFITGDTGPMHIAFSQGTPTIALFSPTNPLVCGPHQMQNAHIVSRKPTCMPCLKKKCQKPFCMMQIAPKEIGDIVTKVNYEKSIA